MSGEFFCPKCRSRTLVRKRLDDGSEVLVCEKCGFAVSAHVLELGSECVPETVLWRLPSQYKARIRKLLATGALRIVERFDLKTGRAVKCLDYDWKHRDVEEAKQVYYQLLKVVKG